MIDLTGMKVGVVESHNVENLRGMLQLMIEKYEEQSMELDAVMQLGIDKWLDEKEQLEPNRAQRATWAREKTLRIIERLRITNDRLSDARTSIRARMLTSKWDSLSELDLTREFADRITSSFSIGGVLDYPDSREGDMLKLACHIIARRHA